MQSDSDSEGTELLNRKKKITKKITKKIWHKQQEEILKRWSEIGSSYRFMHDRSYTKFEKQNLRFALPVIVISTVTGTANFAQGSFPTAWQLYVPLFIGFLNLSAGLLTTVAQFLRVSELLEGHRAAAISYSKFSRNISVELSLPREERTCSGTEFVNNCRTELDRLIEQTPNIPLEIIKSFGKKFELDKFNKPDILTITEVSVFKDDAKQRRFDKLAALKHEEEMRRTVLKTEKLRRASFIEEFTKKKALETEINTKRERKRRDDKKKNVSVSSVQNSMSKLLEKLNGAQQNNTIITPDSSDNERSPSSSLNIHTERNIVLDIKDKVEDEDDENGEHDGNNENGENGENGDSDKE